MTALAQPVRRWFGRSGTTVRAVTQTPHVEIVPGAAVEIPETDPLFAYLQGASGPVDLGRLELDSAALNELRTSGVALVVPLVTQGELIGTLNLGPRLSEQEYSSDDRRLLATLAAQAAPAIRVAQLVREQAAEAAERERYEQELRVAQLIQQQFLPRDLPRLGDWQVAAYYRPARVVGGDFYDFIELDEGRIGLVVGDVTDKGVPAALVMARTHSILRAEAPRLVTPGAVLARANELLVPEMPAKMFVTCLYGILELATGRLVFANAGHNLPYVRRSREVVELRATGMPLGLLPGMVYEETEALLEPGDALLLHSDGLAEAHDPRRDMFGFPRLREAMANDREGAELLDSLLDRLHEFTGPGWEQEDDITLVTVRRAIGERHSVELEAAGSDGVASPMASGDVVAFEIPGAMGGERAAMDRVAEAVAPFGLPPPRLEQLRMAVSETVMNAIEYGSQGRSEIPVSIAVSVTDDDVIVRVFDRALSGPVPTVEMPDLEAKLEGRQRPRGWGLFLIRHMVDAIDVAETDNGQIVTLTVARHDETGGIGR